MNFLGLAGFPGVEGCFDGSLIPIDARKEFEAQYVDWQGNHSINGVFVCGSRMEFFYVSARLPGSDSRVLRNSSFIDLSQKAGDHSLERYFLGTADTES
jgi:hypothetical protein